MAAEPRCRRRPIVDANAMLLTAALERAGMKFGAVVEMDAGR